MEHIREFIIDRLWDTETGYYEKTETYIRRTPLTKLYSMGLTLIPQNKLDCLWEHHGYPYRSIYDLALEYHTDNNTIFKWKKDAAYILANYYNSMIHENENITFDKKKSGD